MTPEEKEKAKKENAEKLAAAQKEMAERYPERPPYFVAEEGAKAVAAPSAAPAGAGTVVSEGAPEPMPGVPPKAPAVPKKN